jgi:hypothetical protein
VPANVVKIWHGKRIVEILQSELTRRLTASAMLVVQHAKELVGKEGAGRRVKAGLNKKGKTKQRIRAVRKRAKLLNAATRKSNKIAKALGRKGKLFTGTYRATKTGTLTKRKRPTPRKKP